MEFKIFEHFFLFIWKLVVNMNMIYVGLNRSDY